MGCYIVPLAVAIISSVVWKRKKGGPQGWWLNLMLYGGALFGAVDHLWNNELFLISEALFSDLLLGVAITAVIFTVWGILITIAKSYPNLGNRMGLSASKKHIV